MLSAENRLNMESTPRGDRIHIGIYGRCNSGKSSLINALTGQHISVVSDTAGTTTDPVSKSMELPNVGAATLIDTAGIDDRTALGMQRMEQTSRAADKTDIAIIVCTDSSWEYEAEWYKRFRNRNTPVIVVLNKTDLISDPDAVCEDLRSKTGIMPIKTCSTNGEGIPELLERLSEVSRQTEQESSITGDLAARGDTVLLIMPQDSQAPHGRLILPQVQTIRELLDKGCVAICTTPDSLDSALASLSAPPHLAITDSQVFGQVSKALPKETLLTSFSVLLANRKGDIATFVKGAEAIGRLTENSRVLIAEACTHAPASEDIGRVKIPKLLRQRAGQGLRIDVTAGSDFPNDLSAYDLIIHCGACMFNRKFVLSRIAQAKESGTPITNYGIAIAYLNGILEKVVYPGMDDARH